MTKKKSFFERLTGAVNTEEDDAFVNDLYVDQGVDEGQSEHSTPQAQEESEEIAQLTIDMYQTDEHIILKTIVAGIPPEELDVSITREMVTISGKRNHPELPEETKHFHDELYWGAFSREAMLPEEIDVEGAEATEVHGLLTITLPKIDKNQSTKLEIKSH